MNNIEQLATFKALEQSRIHRGADLLESFVTSGQGQNLGLKRIQFESHPSLAERLENVCTMLDVTKREFLEAAVIDAMERAEQGFCAVYKEATGREFGEEVQ